MSRALARAEQRPLGAYYTDDAVARQCVCALPIPLAPGSAVFEPSIGGGAFARATTSLWPGAMVLGMDIDPDAAGFADVVHSRVGDFRNYTHDLWPFLRGRDVWFVGNPPYLQAQEHIEHALSLEPVGVAFLLRLGFLEGQKRAAFWRKHPPHTVHVLSKRPSFTVGGTDSAAYGFFVWRNDVQMAGGGTHLLWLT